MKKTLALLLLVVFSFSYAQDTDQIPANRFFYELTFKPRQGVDSTDTVMTILDITEEKSLYKDFTMTAQDSILKVKVEAMQKSGVYEDMTKAFVKPKFTHRIYKDNATKEVTYVEQISSGFTPLDLAYKEKNTFNWQILPDTEKLGEYNTQKASATFGGRQWTAWFTTDIPFQDGPYKFHGLPGLIVKIQDENKDYTWTLKGNKNIEDWKEKSYIESVSPMGSGSMKVVDREKFEEKFTEYKKDPFASARPMLTREVLRQKMPGSDKTIGDMLKDQEKMAKEIYGANQNPIEKE